ncbi:MAG: type VI secretion system ATPase TssH [Desulfobacterales bacterium]|nr:type VI secretion system ATPase TssH [Desulfobacterales bacterium]MDD4393782.1 type VI secretion system ATPase TssH [Desulfobacterales bacterium]
MSLDLQSITDKLNPVCRNGLEAGAQLCVSQTNYNVEIEHLLLKILDIPDTDIQNLFRYYDIRTADVSRELTGSIDRFKRGNSRTPALSPQIIQLLEQAWLLSSLHLNSVIIRSGAVLLALLDHDTLRAVMLESCPSLKRIPVASLKQDIHNLIQNSCEQDSSGTIHEATKASRPSAASKAVSTQTPNLDQYTFDLTERARKGLIDPIQGRNAEIRQIIDILMRRRQNNPILTGEAGVGKTAVVEGFAIRIAKGDVPPALKNISLRLLDLALLQAGAGIKGEFEKRLKSVIDEVKGAPIPIILFIDEAHTMIGAGGPAGMGDAANLLKPVLARGELRTIAATTWSEYKKYFEKDPALARRFQVVKVAEPDEETAVAMLRGIVSSLEAHHQVTVLDEAVRDAVRLSSRYISGRQLPDKAISVLDTASARVAIGQNGTPPEVEDLIRQQEQLTLEIGIIKRDLATGIQCRSSLTNLEADLDKVKIEKQALEKRWKNELEMVQGVLKLQNQLQEDWTAKPGNQVQVKQLKQSLIKQKKELEVIQNDSPMVPSCVDSRVIASVISNWTGIPSGKMMTDEIDTVLNLRKRMAQRIIGQPQALDTVSRRIRTFWANLDDPDKPVGVFLLVGPSGIGKTETAITLSDLLYGGDRNMVTVNMSEYQEAHTVSGLKGAPPGYVGHGKGGVLTEAVRHNPYSVVLLDEVEKGHPDVMELFYQVFDKGTLEDSEGLSVDFRNTVILLTSNVGSDIILKACDDPDHLPDADKLVEMVRPALLRYFKPAFLGRLVIVPYYPLDDGVIQQIVRLKMNKVKQRFAENHRINLTYSTDLIAAIASRCTEVDTGARNVDYLLTQVLLPELSTEMLKRMAQGQMCTGIYAYLDRSGNFNYRFEPPLTQKEPLVSDRPPEPASDRIIPDAPDDPFQPQFMKSSSLIKKGIQKSDHIRPNKRNRPTKSVSWLNIFKR